MNNWVVRSCTGLAYVAVITAGILYGAGTFAALFLLVTILCLWEFYDLIRTQKQIRIYPWYHCLFGGGWLFIATFLYAACDFPLAIFIPYLLYLILVLVSELYEKQPDPIMHIAAIFLGQVYIALPVALLNGIAFPAGATGIAGYNPVGVLALFVFLWVNDTGAYVTGSLFGKHRLLERISPKKSWEGFFGGLLFTAASSLLFARFEPGIPVYHWVGLSLAVAIFGTWGDLVESLIKRTLGVKDSGKILPGHGGFLDRFDSFLLAVYAVWFYTQLFI